MPLASVDPGAAHRLAAPQQIQRKLGQAPPDLLHANATACLERPRHGELRAHGRSHARNGTTASGRLTRIQPPASLMTAFATRNRSARKTR